MRGPASAQGRMHNELSPETNADGRVVINWRACDWQPFPGSETASWCPVRVGSRPEEGYYLLKLAPGETAPAYGEDVREELILLDGALNDSDGAELVAGDFVSYLPGTDHRLMTAQEAVLLVYTTPAAPTHGDAPPLGEARRIANWKTAPFEPYPGLPNVDRPLLWHDIRGNPVTAEGFYITRFTPGATSAAHEHTGFEEFVILEGSLLDSDGTTYGIDDCVSLPPGSIHGSRSLDGCCVSSMINGPFRTL